MLVHAAAIVLLVLATAHPFLPYRVQLIQLQPPAAGTPRGSPEAAMPIYALGGGTGRGGAEAGPGTGGRGEGTLPVEPPRDTGLIRLPFDVANLRPLHELLPRPGGPGGDSLHQEEGAIGTARLLGPAYGDGRLWARTQEAAMGIVGPAESAELHVARVDSVVRAKLMAFLDTMPRDSFAIQAPPPWTTEIAGKPWGIDGSWIYLGDLKIPTALLALLPWPQGNYAQAQRAAELARMRTDILQAAQRAETADEFKHYVEEVRKRMDAERAAAKARRDTIIP